LTTAYDRVAYPSAIFARTHPDRLATIATLHGLTPPVVATARVLEIGCGDGLNICAMAAAFPKAQFEGFDLSAVAIDRGKALVAAAGLSNISLSVLDATKAVSHYAAGSFDYVIAHGIYAWVPEFVQAAIMGLIGHALSPNGVALISYNALPGGHMRMIMRDMLLLQTEGIDDAVEKLATARRFLQSLDTDVPTDEGMRLALREQARSMLNRPDGVLFHDELGEVYAPQSLQAMAAAAVGAGLRYLSDTGRRRQLDGFFPEEHVPGSDPEREIVRLRQMEDHIGLRFFRHTLFVRGERAPIRVIDTKRLEALWMSAHLLRSAEGTFIWSGDEIQVTDAKLAVALDKLTERWPQRVRVDELIKGKDRLVAVLQLFSNGYVELHNGPLPFPLAVGEKPCASPLLRAQLARGDARVCALSHVLMEIKQPALRHLLQLADGSRDMEEIANNPTLKFPTDEVPLALAAAAKKGIMLA
jgi:SAM-dependent methyltransferase